MTPPSKQVTKIEEEIEFWKESRVKNKTKEMKNLGEMGNIKTNHERELEIKEKYFVTY